ncbi:Adaptor protein complex beta subunit [Dichomitus squalens]|uniref:AP complex subunit beta n=1 Tax=Dichomitus squalens TaxID=114155 RepID=A0A4Q9QFC7_9APHY|nr:Adaptor protein complex beta subunit [Dichomitus squalens LYAD-421 SS1]EJF65789.1 Adaptor protein complex beta subunit [Dichomitus squalens LYAD-421 SS1]TBU32418.1 Adaptor protein complex beta subunit [Dichomitus squalens]TBU50695.1 Adaptor protein complex beta subunit [Dichomitus squalens]TBU65911.1 Adaptor protein complex beta subunit [Dichomitus squalens]
MSGQGGQDAKFFQRGKIQEFRAELEAAESKDKKFTKRKTVLKKIVANITMGNDMSPLFTDVVQSLGTPLLEIKKMVYLFLVCYGRQKADQLHLVIPHFLQDCNDRNPLVRALAIRTMSYIPTPIVIEALTEQLRHCLKDRDPYVRKTAAICVAKLYTADPRKAEKGGFVEMLRDLLLDSNATVVANAVAALSEIGDRQDGVIFKLNLTVANKLLTALGESSEWGTIYILDSLLRYIPERHIDAEMMAERVIVQLNHANSAVVLTAIKVLLYLMNYMENRKLMEYICKKMGPPLVTLLSSGPEVQYVALRNILLIIQRRPSVLKNDVKVFFCKYNDPIYVKLAKLEIMYRLAREENAKEVLAELQEYASEVDVDFVRKAVRSIGRLAIKVQEAADSCIQALLDLMDTKVSYVVQEAVIVIKDVFRRYPGKYEGIIPKLCEHLDLLDEPESKAAVIWIIGQFANRIENADELMDDLTYTFLEEPTEVQLALLTAAVKLFIYKAHSDTTKALVHKVLKWATEDVDNPDLRDRGFMYWRMLAINPAVAGEIVLAEKPAITTDADRMDRGALDQLLLHTGTLGSIYHKNPETFIRNATGRALADSPALNPLSRQVLVPASRPNLPLPAIVVPGPGPQEISQSNGTNGSLVATGDPPEPTRNGSTGDVARRRSQESPSNEGDGDDDDDDEAPVSSRPAGGDPYAGLDSAFGGSYVADEPRPQNQDLLDLI